MTQSQLLLKIDCPHCQLSVVLTGTTLEGIIRGRLAKYEGDHVLTLVCQRCKIAYQQDYRHLESTGVIDVSPQKGVSQNAPAYFSVVVGCVDSNCQSPLALTVLRDPHTTKEQMLAEMPQWKLDGICCAQGYPIR